MTRPTKITSGELRPVGVRNVLVYVPITDAITARSRRAQSRER